MTQRGLASKLPEFKTERLLLREIQVSDYKSYQKKFSDYEIIRYLSNIVPWPYPDNGALDFLQSVILPKQGIDLWCWAICLKEKRDDMIGVIEIRKGPSDNRGFWIAREHQGKGFMTEATVPTTDYAFNKLGFEKLVFLNALENKASRRIKEKTGVRLVGTCPRKFVDPQYTMAQIWELTKEDYNRINPTTPQVFQDRPFLNDGRGKSPAHPRLEKKE